MTTVDDIKKLDEIAYGLMMDQGLDVKKPVVKVQEVHSDSYVGFALESLMNTENWKLSLDEVRRIHGMSFTGKNILSEYKTVENTFSSPYYVFYIPALPEEVPDAMDAWLDKYRDYNSLETIIKAEMDICSIHPFNDGNGRTAFCLMRVMMREIGYRCALHINIDKHIKNRNTDNIRAINKSAGRGWGLQTVDYSVYTNFMLEILEAAYYELISALK